MTRLPLRLRGAGVVLSAILAVLTATVQPAAAARSTRSQSTRLDHHLRNELNAGQSREQRVIVRAKPGARAALQRALAAHGDRIVAEHASIDAFTAVVHGEDLEALAAADGVISVSADARVRPTGLLGGLLSTTTDLLVTAVDVLLPNGADTSGPAVYPKTLRATLGTSGTWVGRGVGVAVIDSGLEYSDEFKYRIRGFYDFTQGGIPTYPYDDYGHGTHVAGTIGGSGALSYEREYRGLAPKVGFVILKVLDKNGAGWTSDVIKAVDFAVENRVTLGIDIINLSLGHPIFEPAATDPLVQAVERAARAGIIVVAAAGNYGKNPDTGLPGYAGITSPGNAPSAVTVGALKTLDTVSRSDDRIPDYSSAGPTWYDAMVKPDLVAPGHNIVAAAAKKGTLYKTYPQLAAADSDYMRLSGTSMATAVASGVLAGVLEANRNANDYPESPSLTPNAAKAVLQYTAIEVYDDLGLEYNALRAGAGALNARGALDLAVTIDTSAPEGSPWLTTPPSPWSKIGGDYYSWNQAVIWGAAVVWGATVEYNEAAWGTAVIWGADVTWDTAVIWGANLVWTDPQSWGSAVIWGADSIGTTDGEAVIWGATGEMTEENTVWQDLEGNATATNGSSLKR